VGAYTLIGSVDKSMKAANEKPVRFQSTIVTNNVILYTDQAYTYQLIDEAGRLLQKGNIGAGFVTIDVGGLRSGILFLQMRGRDTMFTRRLIKR